MSSKSLTGRFNLLDTSSMNSKMSSIMLRYLSLQARLKASCQARVSVVKASFRFSEQRSKFKHSSHYYWPFYRHSLSFCKPRLENYGKPWMQKQKQIATVCNNVTQLFQNSVEFYWKQSNKSCEIFYLIESWPKQKKIFANIRPSMPTSAVCLSTIERYIGKK